MTDTNATVETTPVAAVEPVVFFGSDFNAITGKVASKNVNAAKVLLETIVQFKKKQELAKKEKELTFSALSYEELKRMIEEAEAKNPNAGVAVEELKLTDASINEILQVKGNEIGAYIVELLNEVAEQVSAYEDKKVKSTDGTKNPKAPPAKAEIWVLKVEGVNDNKHFFASNIGPLSKNLSALSELLGDSADKFKTFNPAKKGDDKMAWDKSKLFEHFGTKLDVSREQFGEKFKFTPSLITEVGLKDLGINVEAFATQTALKVADVVKKIK